MERRGVESGREEREGWNDGKGWGMGGDSEGQWVGVFMYLIK